MLSTAAHTHCKQWHDFGYAPRPRPAPAPPAAAALALARAATALPLPPTPVATFLACAPSRKNPVAGESRPPTTQTEHCFPSPWRPLETIGGAWCPLMNLARGTSVTGSVGLGTLCLGSMRLNMGAFFSMSGMIINRILLPRRNTWSKCATLPSCETTKRVKLPISLSMHGTMLRPGPLHLDRCTRCNTNSIACHSMTEQPDRLTLSVAVTFFNWQFQLSSASNSSPL